MSGVVRWYGEKVKAAAKRGAVRGLESWSGEVLEGSQRRVPVAPIRGGFLHDSAKAQVDEGALRAAVSYASPPARVDGRATGSGNLAVWVHENMRARHAAGKSAKYLEIPLNESRKTGPERVRREIAKEIG
jgi:hypothetical protein